MKRHNYTNPATRLIAPLILLVGLTTVAAKAQTDEPVISMAMREASLAEVMQMLSRAERVNILLSDDVEGEVSFSIYDVPLSEAIRSIADAAGYAVEHRNGMYFVVDRDEAGAYADLLIVDGNPLRDITVIGGNELWLQAPKPTEIANIRLIMKDGVVYKNTLQ